MRTAEEILDKHVLSHDKGKGMVIMADTFKVSVINAMKEYAEQALILASEQADFKELTAEERVDGYWKTIEDYMGDIHAIDRQSILDLKSQLL